MVRPQEIRSKRSLPTAKIGMAGELLVQRQFASSPTYRAVVPVTAFAPNRCQSSIAMCPSRQATTVASP
jgi:hypothetical protein